jgi:hypothetical protein
MRMQAIQLRILFLSIFCSIFCSALFGQAAIKNQRISTSSNTAPFIKLVKSTGHVIQTIKDSRGGFVSISNPGSRKFLLRRIRPSGEPTLERIIQFQSDPFIDHLSLNAIRETNDGGFALVGEALDCGDPYCDDFNNFKYAGIAAKLHPDGTIQWTKRFTLTATTSVRFYSVASLPDGGFIASGDEGNSSGNIRKAVLIRFNSAGDIVWTKLFQSVNGSNQLLSTTANTFIHIGITNNGDAEVIKLNQAGNVVWGKSFKASGFIFRGAIVTSDKGIVLGGVCGECNQLLLIRLNLNGEIIWKNAWQGEYAQPVFFGPVITDFTQTPDGGFAVAGQITLDKSIPPNSFLLTIDSSVQAAFQKNYRTSEDLNGFLFTSGSGYLVFRQSQTNTRISKFNSQGIIPGCSSFYSVPVERIDFRELTTKRLNIKEPVSFSLQAADIAATSVEIHPSLSTVCQ